MAHPFKTKTFIATSGGQARMAADRLVVGSCWFEVTPIPDDRYEFVVKDETEGPVLILRLLKMEEET